MNNPLLAAAPQNNAVVKASAGVGKTYLLVTRLLRLLLAGVRPDAILAVTFTRKAAGEMQSRLLERLYELCSADDDTLKSLLQQIDEATDADTMQRARGLFEYLLRHEASVKTTTFHAFCQDILRRFPLEADVPPGFELVEKTGALEAEAWEALYALATAQPESKVAVALNQLLDDIGSSDSMQDALNSFFHNRSDWWAYTFGEVQPLEFAIEQLRQQLEIDEHASPYSLLNHASVLEMLDEFVRLLQMHPNKGNNAHAEQLATTLQTPADLNSLYSACFEVFLTKKAEPRARKASDAQRKKMGAEGEERFLHIHDEMCTRLARIREQLNRLNTFHTSRNWYICGQAFLDHYQRIKAEQRLLDFADLEWKAFALLNHSDNAQWVQYKLDQRIEHLLIDEFQDTNPTQWRLLLPLMEEMAHSGERNRSVFIVGDDKQSIYGFRRADPRLLDRAGNWLKENLDARQYPMDKSRRSASAIMQAVNHTFENQQDGVRLPSFSTHDTHLDKLWGQVEMLPLIEVLEVEEEEVDPFPLRNPLKQPRAETEPSTHYREGQAVAEKVRQLINSRTPVGKSNEARAMQYRDIMLLLRTRTHVRDYERALREANIPYLGADRGTLLEAQEIQDMVALLETLTMPFSNLALATVLKSPLFACNEDDLIWLAQQSSEQNWFDALIGNAPPTPALQRAANLLGYWHSLSGLLPIHDLVDQVFHQGDVLSRYEAAFPEHLRARAQQNLGKFLELALEIDSGRYPTTGRFLNALRGMRQSADEAPDEASPGEAANAVRILTIHASKGLEAPVVFLLDTTSSKQADKGYRAHVDWPESEPRPKHFFLVGKKDQQDRISQLLLEKQANRDRQEDANLLYVAMTRARQMLFASGCNGKKTSKENWYQSIAQNWPDQDVIESNNRPMQLHPEAAPISVEVPAPDWLQPRTPDAAESDTTPSAMTDEDPEWSGERARERGTAIHRFLQVLSENSDADLQRLRQQLAFELSLDKDHPLLQECEAEAQACLQSNELSWLFDGQTFPQSWNEVPLQYLDGQRLVHGVADRLLANAEELLLVDYKTHRVQSQKEAEELAQRYAPQLRAYSEALRAAWPEKNLQAKLVFTHLKSSVTVSIN